MSNEKARVLVAGATGYIGGGVARALHDKGYWVRGLSRDADRLRDAEFVDDVFVGQATRAETLRGMCDGVDVVFSSVGVHSFARRPTIWDVDYQANINILEEAKRAGVKHFVFVTVVHGPEMAKISPIAEARERVAEAVKASGMDYNIFAPTAFFNDMQELVKSAKRLGVVFIFGYGDGVLNPLSAMDLGDEVARVIEDPALRNTVRDVGGIDRFTHREAAELAFGVVEKKPRVVPIPPVVFKLASYAARPFHYNLYALGRFFEFMARSPDMSGEPIGRRHMKAFYENVAAGKTLLEAEAAL
jgi:uncharacterized protein YbjT (DUF2867 family)